MEPSSSPDPIAQDFSAHLFPSTSQAFVDSSNAVLKSTKTQLPDLNTVTQAASGPQVAISLSVGTATNAKNRDIQISTLPFFTTLHDSVELLPSHLR